VSSVKHARKRLGTRVNEGQDPLVRREGENYVQSGTLYWSKVRGVAWERRRHLVEGGSLIRDPDALHTLFNSQGGMGQPSQGENKEGNVQPGGGRVEEPWLSDLEGGRQGTSRTQGGLKPRSNITSHAGQEGGGGTGRRGRI